MNRLTWLLLAILSATVIAWAPAPALRSVANQPPDPALIPPALFAHVDVLGAYPHDTNAFTEGLVWYSDGFFESTGLNGESTLRQVAFPSGEVTRSVPLSNRFFGEGLTLVDDHLIQLTWQNQLALIYDRDSFDPRGTFTYGSEGWGLTYDGTSLIRSDGTPTLTFLDPASYQTTRTLPVTLDGKPVQLLNELEWIRGEIWANVWQTDLIVRIDPATGTVTSVLNLDGLYPHEKRSDVDDVLNGIAYDASTDRIFITGKRWPNLYEIRVQ